MLYHNKFIILFTQIIYKKFKKSFLILQYLEKNSSILQWLTYRAWHQVNRPEELLIGGGRGVRDDRAEGLSTVGDIGQASFTHV